MCVYGTYNTMLRIVHLLLFSPALLEVVLVLPVDTQKRKRRSTSQKGRERSDGGRGGGLASTRYSGSSMRSGPIATRIQCRTPLLSTFRRGQSQQRCRVRSSALLAPGDGSPDLGEHREYRTPHHKFIVKAYYCATILSMFEVEKNPR